MPFDEPERFPGKIQRLRSLTKIPVMAGKSPPRHPSGRGANDNPAAREKWMAAADSFAAYVITMFRPWSFARRGPDIPLTYAGLMCWVHELRLSPLIQDAARLFWLRNVTSGLVVDKEAMKCT
jgi:hypothetical protein